MSLLLSSRGEVGTFQNVDQFQVGKSQYECGFWAIATVKAMGKPDAAPTQNVAQISAEAELWYAQFDGSDAISNTNGMTLPQLYTLIKLVGLHYQAITTDIQMVMAWVRAGYPVVIAITETSVDDLEFGHTPYPWTPAGSHVIVVTGVKDGNVLVRDSANCTNLYNPNSLRPGPRLYDVSKLQLVSATVVVPPWLPRPAAADAPKEPVLWLDSPLLVDWVLKSAQDTWRASTGWNGGPPPENTQLFDSYVNEYRAGHIKGVPMRGWLSHDDHGNAIAVMECTNGRAEDTNGVIRWIY